MRSSLEETAQLFLILQLVGSPGTNADIWLGEEWVAGILCEIQSCLQPLGCLELSGRTDSSLGIVFLHLRFLLDAHDLVLSNTGSDMEGCAQLGIHVQPELIVGLNPVDRAIVVCIIGHCLVHLFIVQHVGYLIIFGKCSFQFRNQFLIRRIANSQHGSTVFLQGIAELPELGGEVGRNKNKIHSLFILVY